MKPNHSSAASQSRAVISFHPWELGFKPPLVNKCLAEAAELGAGYVRSDVRWRDFVPDGVSVNEEACAWYLAYFRAMSQWYGLKPMIVLYDPPQLVRRDSVAGRLVAWNKYVKEVLNRFGGICETYQVLNEPNNPVFQIFPFRQTAEAFVSAAKLIHTHNPKAKVVINVLAGLWRWRTYVGAILRETGPAVDVIGLDYFPGTWTLSPRSDWQDVIDFLHDAGGTVADSALRGRAVGIIETGYSTNVAHWRNENQQARYFQALNDALPGIDAAAGPRGLALVGVYAICDADSTAFFDPEAHFGLLRSDTLARKAGFAEVQRIFRSLGQSSAS